MKNNTYFEEFARIGSEWTKRHNAHEALKDQIIREHGWDSPELKAWRIEEEAMKPPFTPGAAKAYRAWKYCDHDELLYDDFVWESEAADFIDTFRKAGITTMVVTNRSTALMENLHWFAAQGCEMLGLCTVTRKSDRWGEEEEEQVMGIRFRL